jgi:hypothetical protein
MTKILENRLVSSASTECRVLAVSRATSKPEPLSIRPFYSRDWRSVQSLLCFLPTLYPSAYTWLDGRLTDVINGKATCTVLTHSNTVLGITIETPKGLRRVKLSTIYVHPSVRGKYWGTRLLLTSIRNWVANGIDESVVTVDSSRYHSLESVLSKNGFQSVTSLQDRYRPDQREIILKWSCANEPLGLDGNSSEFC